MKFNNILYLVSILCLLSCKQEDKAYPIAEAPVATMEFYQASLEAVERFAESDPDNADAFYKKSIYLEALGRTEEALTAVKQAINLDPTPDYLMKEAELLVETGDVETALARISRAQILGGDYPELWHLMSELNYSAGNYQVALDEVDLALQKYPEGVAYYCTKGKIQWAMNDTLNALQSFTRCENHAPTRYESLKNLAMIYRALGDYPKAFSYLNQNLRYHKDDRDLLFDKGKLYAETAKYDSATVLFHQLKKQDTTDQETLFQLALIHFNIRWYDSTLFYTNQVLQLQDDNLEALLTEARVYDKRTYYGTSMKKYQEILAIDSTYQPAVEELAKLKGKVAYLQKIRQEREANSQVEVISPTRPPIRE